MSKSENNLPPCGLYRTTETIAGVPPDALVYFHNHGNPGPGLYLPKSWSHNKATFHEGGHTVEDLELAQTLKALPPEGFYRVDATFHCCQKQCRSFEESAMVQLGYNRKGDAILFLPTFSSTGMALPERGNIIEDAHLEKLSLLKVAFSRDNGPPGPTIH
jgi:hypothetical protein